MSFKNNIGTKRKIFYLELMLITIASFAFWKAIGHLLRVELLMTVDDIASVQFAMAEDSLPAKLQNILQNEPTNVPLFYMLLCVWINLWGYATEAMRMLPRLFGVCTVFVMGIIGREVDDESTGCLCAVAAGLSVPLISSNFQIRAYSLVIFATALSFLLWIFRNTMDGKTGFTRKKSLIINILFSISLLMLGYSHFFGTLICCALISYDLFLVIMGVKRPIKLLPYLVYIILFIPYLVVAYLNAQNVWGTFWTKAPQFRDIYYLLVNISPLAKIGFIFLLAYFCYKTAELFNNRDSLKGFLSVEKNMTVIACYWVTIAVIVVAFIYSRYVKPTGSVWVERYFYVLVPFLIVLIGHIVYMIRKCIILCNKNYASNISGAMGLLILFMLFINSAVTISENPSIMTWNGSNFEQAIQEVINQNDIYDDNTLVYFTYPDYYYQGVDILISKDGYMKEPEMVYTHADFESALEDYDTLYVIDIVYKLTDEEVEMIKADGFVSDPEFKSEYLQKYIKKR